MMIERIFTIAVSLFILFLGAEVLFNSYLESVKSKYAISAGLEECPVPGNLHMTVWVKDCMEFTQMYTEHNMKQENEKTNKKEGSYKK